MKNCSRTSFGLSLILCMIVGSVMFTSCSKKEQPTIDPTDLSLVSPTFIDYFDFMSGSEWVYVNSISGQRDTVVVVGRSTQITKKDWQSAYYTSIYPDYLQDIEINTYSYRTGVFKIYSLNTDNVFITNFNCVLTKTSLGSVQSMEDPINFGVARISHDTSGQLTDTVIALQKFDYMQIGNNTFYEVIKIYHSSDFTGSNSPENYYYAKNVGLIKIESAIGANRWDLENYYIRPRHK